jgi:hypothetical protein
MIVRTDGDRLLLIRQTDHAELSGRLAEAWGGRFARPEPFDAVVLAAALHDDGWQEWEAEPKVDPKTRLPYSFTAMPPKEHLAFYLRGIDRVLERDPYAGLLVSMHCAGLYRQRYGTDLGLKLRRFTPDVQTVVEEFLERLDSQQQELRERLGRSGPYARFVEDGPLWTNYKLLQMYDRLSLYLCIVPLAERCLGPAPTGYAGGETTLTLGPVGDRTVLISPYPFRETPLRVSVKARRVPNRPYDSDEEFRSVLAQAESVSLDYGLRAGD